MAAPVSIPMQVIAMKANGTVTANRLVKLNATAGEVLHTTAITENAFGVAQETVNTGLMTSVEVGNGAVVKLVASGSITAGDPLMPAAGGAGKVATLAGSTALSCGQALEGAADGATFTALFRPTGKSPASA